MRVVATALAALALFALAACGDSDEPTSESPATTAVQTAPDPDASKGEQSKAKPSGERGHDLPVSKDSGIEGPAPLGDRYDPGASDGKIHGDGSIERFGEAADDGEAQAAVAVAVGYYDARAAYDWERACGLISSGMRQQLEQMVKQGGGKAKSGGCADALAGLTGGLPREVLAKQAKSLRFTGFRIEGDGGYALFVSDTIPNGFVPMHRDDDGWRVAAISGSAL